MSDRGAADVALELDELEVLTEAAAADADRYRTLFATAPAPLLVTDALLKVVDANAAAAQLLGIAPRFVVNKMLAAYVDGEGRPAFRRWQLAAARAGGTHSTSLRMRRRTGVAFDARLTATFTGREIFWAIVDETEQRQLEWQLWQLNRELEERVAAQAGELEAVYDELPVGVAIVDPRSPRARRVNRRGRQLLDAWGVALVDLVGNDGESFARRALAGEVVRREVCRVTTPGGEEVAVEVSSVPLHLDGLVGAAAVTFDDLTERERRERAESEFVDNAAHQLRTPVTAIASAVAVLEAGAKDDQGARDQFLAHIARESRRMADLSDALLTLARVQRRVGPPLVASTRLARLLEPLLASMRPVAGVALVLECPDELALLADDRMVAEAIRNVVANAVAHTRTGSVSVHAVLVGDELTVEVADTGSGIRVADRERIFERFYRGAADRTSGAGLGLAIARELAEANGGSLELVRSGAGGSTFRFVFRGARLAGIAVAPP